MEIVRDFLQNFYDDNRPEDITIQIEGSTVTVLAPKSFDPNLLIYLGSDKGPDQVGKYGEGFKAAMLNAMRNHNCTVRMITANEGLDFFFEKKVIGERERDVIMCRRSPMASTNGSKLIISNCPPEITAEFKFGLNCFYHENNPLFGAVIATSWQEDLLVFRSTTDVGYLFYGKLLRAKLDAPLVIVCNKRYKNIDNQIEHDRDRKAFNEEVLGKCIRQVFRGIGVYRCIAVINFLKPWWQKGHPILAALADAAGYNFKMDYPVEYYAKHSFRDDDKVDFHMRIDEMRRTFREKGWVECPHYMSDLGMKTIPVIIADQDKKVTNAQINELTRRPSPHEQRALDLLIRTAHSLDSGLADKFTGARYVIGASKEIIGELRKTAVRHDKCVYLTKSVFTGRFSDAVAVLLHEWSHLYGHDGSRGFTDILTDFIARSIEERNSITAYEQEWQPIADEIRKSETETPDVGIILNRLSSAEKSALIRMLPEETVFSLLRDKGYLQKTDGRSQPSAEGQHREDAEAIH